MSPGTCAAKPFLRGLKHNVEVISKKCWAVAFKKQETSNKRQVAWFVLLILSMLWDENHYDKSLFWVHSALFEIIEKVLPFALDLHHVYLFLVHVFFNYQSFITKWTVLWWTNVSNRRYLWCHGWTSWTCSCQWQETRSTILGLTTWTSKQKPRIDLFIWFSVGMIHVVTDYWSPYASRIALIEIIPGGFGHVTNQECVCFNGVSCHRSGFFLNSAGHSERFSLSCLWEFLEPIKKYQEMVVK